MTIIERVKSALFPNEKCVIAITGLSKNAGENISTQLVNVKLPDYSYGITTTGRDGEDKDLVFGTDKPKVRIKEGTLFTSFASEIVKQSHIFKVLEKTEYTASGKKLWIIQSNQDTEVEIVGPASVVDQQKIIDRLHFHGANTIIVDGSLDRKAITLSSRISSIIVSASADFGDEDSIITELKRLLLLNSIEVSNDIPEVTKYIALKDDNWVSSEMESLLGNEDQFLKLCKQQNPAKIFIPGAITSSSWKKIGAYICDYGGTVVVKHPFNIQINLVYLELLLREAKVVTQNRFKVNAIAVNSNSVKGNYIDSEKLLNKVRTLFPDLPVIDTKSIE